MPLTQDGHAVAHRTHATVTLWEYYLWEAMKTLTGSIVTHYDQGTQRPVVFHPPDAIVNAAWIADETCNMIAARSATLGRCSHREIVPPASSPSGPVFKTDRVETIPIEGTTPGREDITETDGPIDLDADYDDGE